MPHRSEVICCYLSVPRRATGDVNVDTKCFTVINKAQALETLKLCDLLDSWKSGLRDAAQMAAAGRKLRTGSSRGSSITPSPT